MQKRILLTLVCAASLAGAQPLSIQAALGIRGVANRSPISLSPSGDWVAYTVEDPSRHESTSDPLYRSFTRTGVFLESRGCDVWVTDTKAGKTINLTEAKGSSWGPVWSPDGKWLAFYSDRGGATRLWLWDKATGAMKQLSDAMPHPYFNFAVPRWTPDSRKLLIKALPEGVTIEQAARTTLTPSAPTDLPSGVLGSTVTVYRSSATPADTTKAAPGGIEDKPFLNQYTGDLALIDIATARVDRIATGIRPLGYWISPDGAQVVFTNAKGVESNTQQVVFRLEIVPANGGHSKVLSADVRQTYGIAVRWSPDSRSIAYTTDGQTAKGDCWVVAIDGGAPKSLTPGTHPSLGSTYQAPIWNQAGDTVYAMSGGKVWKMPLTGTGASVFAAIPGYNVMEIAVPQAGGPVWTPAGASMVVMAKDVTTRDAAFFALDRDGKSTPLFHSPILTRGAFDLDMTGDGSMAFISQDATHPDDIWMARDSFRSTARVSQLNPQIESAALGNSRLIDWTSEDGQLLHGALLLPSGYQSGKRYPLVVNVYGGSNLSEDVHRFGLRDSTVDNMQILATRGYAVLTPDAPLHAGTPMRDLLKTVMPGVDRAVDLGIADPNRLGVMGHSYGGYSTLSLIVQTTRFAAAVDSAGISDMISFYGQMDPSGSSFALGWAETGQGRMEGSPWQYRERYIENSPLFYLDHVRTPLLIVQGRLDHAVVEEQSDELFIGLQRLGREVEYAKYGGEEHWEGTWSLANVTDYWTRVLRWFDGHLKGVSENDAK